MPLLRINAAHAFQINFAGLPIIYFAPINYSLFNLIKTDRPYRFPHGKASIYYLPGALSNLFTSLLTFSSSFKICFIFKLLMSFITYNNNNCVFVRIKYGGLNIKENSLSGNGPCWK